MIFKVFINKIIIFVLYFVMVSPIPTGKESQYIFTRHDLSVNQNQVTGRELNRNYNNSQSSWIYGVVISTIFIVLCLVGCFSCCYFIYRKARQQQIQRRFQQTFWEIIGTAIVNAILGMFGMRPSPPQRSNIEIRQNYIVRQQPVNPYIIQHNNIHKTTWYQVSELSQQYKTIKKQKCSLCNGKQRGSSYVVSSCSQSCVFHLQCLIKLKNIQQYNLNTCPCCNQYNQNIFFFYCKRCQKKYTQISLQNTNAYGVSQLNVQQIVNSIDKGKCEVCVNNKWFWQ